MICVTGLAITVSQETRSLRESIERLMRGDRDGQSYTQDLRSPRLGIRDLSRDAELVRSVQQRVLQLDDPLREHFHLRDELILRALHFP